MPTGLSSVPNSHGKKYSQLNLNSPLYLTGIFSILSAQAWGDGVTGSSEACLKYPLFSRIPEIFDANARFIGSHDHGDGRQCRVRPDACFLESNLRLPKVRQGSYSFRERKRRYRNRPQSPAPSTNRCRTTLRWHRPRPCERPAARPTSWPL